jgi:hypothetical protein
MWSETQESPDQSGEGGRTDRGCDPRPRDRLSPWARPRGSRPARPSPPRATAARRRSPEDNSGGFASRRSVSPTQSSSARTSCARNLGSSPATLSGSATLSSTLRWSSRSHSCDTRPSRRRTRARSPRPIDAVARPKRVTAPDCGARDKWASRSRVVFPAPDRPVRKCMVPGSSESVASSITQRSSYPNRTPANSITDPRPRRPLPHWRRRRRRSATMQPRSGVLKAPSAWRRESPSV